MRRFKTINIIVFATATFFILMSSDMTQKDTRIIEGQILDKETKAPIKTTVEFHRKGNAWHVRSGEDNDEICPRKY